MKLLHIAGAFAQHPLYSELTDHIQYFVEHQLIFAAVRTAEQAARQPPGDNARIDYQFRHMLNPMHRLLFRTKIRQIRGAVSRFVDASGVDLVHAHTLYSDGAVALRLKKDRGWPYVVAVRNTDLNIFMRWRPDLFYIARRVLLESERIIFLSPAYQLAFLSKLGPSLRSSIEDRCSVVPNGLDKFWYESAMKADRSRPPLRLLYVGDSSRNKNIAGTVRAAALLVKDIPLQLTLVGNGRDEPNVRHLLDKHPFVRHIGRVDDRSKLRSIYQQHDVFVMPSFTETFGVVYLEALSQGLPVVHAHGQGIDGYFSPNTVSESVDPGNPADIAEGIKALAERLDDVKPMARQEAKQFTWSNIAQIYSKLYADAAFRPLTVGGNN